HRTPRLGGFRGGAFWLCGSVLRVFGPPLLPFGGQRADRVVVLVAPAQRVRVVPLQRGAVVLRPVRDAARAVVVGQLVYPALADVRHVADDPRRRVAGQV